MSPELCYNYFQQVSRIIQQFCVSPIIPFNCFLNTFLQNIYDVLPESYKRKIVGDYFPAEHLKLWNIIGVDRILDDCIKDQICLVLSNKLVGLMDDFFKENISVEKYYEMVSFFFLSIYNIREYQL